MRVAIVGRGRVGTGLAKALRAAGIDARLTSGHAPRGLAKSTGVVLAVPDPVLREVALAHAAAISDTPVVHCSGSLDPSVLRPCRVVGAMHPLVSFADARRSPSLPGTSFLIAGDPGAVRFARTIAGAVGAHCIEAPIHGAAYHAAAALSANGAAALATVAVRVLEQLGVSPKDAARAIGALLRSVGDNVERVQGPAALSGPVMRGDADTVARHRGALEALDPPARAAYDAVAPAILDCARRAGLPPRRLRAVRAALERPASDG